jgi:UTP--glucose-1-phosphate uridylyltransferase
MLTIVDRPIIHYAVEEAIEAGCETMIFITGHTKQAIMDYFEASPELEAELESKGKTQALSIIRNIIPSNVKCIFIRQHQPLGLGHAVLCAADLIDPDEPFAVLLPDDLIDGVPKGALAQLADVYQRTGKAVIAVEKVPDSQVSQYGIIKPKNPVSIPLEIEGIVEKPSLEQAPSNWSVVGRYILTYDVMQTLKTQSPGAGGEIQLTDAIDSCLSSNPFLGLPFHGKRFDCGSKRGFLEANMHFGLDS